MTINRPQLVSVTLGNGRQTGKSLMTGELAEELAGDFDGDSASLTMPTFTWTERYDSLQEHRRYFANWMGLIRGYMGEAKPPHAMPAIHRIYPFGGQQLTRRARILESWNPKTNRPPRRFWIPARRFAGFKAYGLGTDQYQIKYLDRPMPLDWSLALYIEETSFKSWRYRPGTIVITYPEDFGGWKTINDVGSLRPSERRARYSSTMDNNGKPRKKKR